MKAIFIFVAFALLAIGNAAVVQNFTKPTYTSSTTLTWSLSNINYLGLELHPTNSMLFQIPAAYQSGVVRTVVLVHRKDEKYQGSITWNSDGTYYDSQGAYDSIQCRNKKDGSYESWIAPKFAEPRSASDPENENLHDWVYYVGVFSTNLIQLVSSSPADEPLAVANIHMVSVEFFPLGTIDSTQIEIFSSGTSFVDLAKKVYLPQYGGGPDAGLSYQEMEDEGLYPNAIEIGSWGFGRNVSKNCYVDYYGDMHIILQAGKVLGGVEVSLGDTNYDQSIPPQDQINKDGGYGQLGWAKLTATLSESDEDCMYNYNVPPNGVLSGGPETSGYVVQKGEELILYSSSYSWVMGYKIVYMKSSLDSE